MFRKVLGIIVHLMVFVFLTVTTQIGGILYVIPLLIIKTKSPKYQLKRIGLFFFFYFISAVVLVPILAPIFGRESIETSEHLEARTFMTDLMNRNYVRPELNQSLQKIAAGLHRKHEGIKLVYLDANFPFMNGFPLLPHVSHSDGKKIDLSLIYEDAEGNLKNSKPSVSGYGVFEGPKPNEYDQIQACLDKGKSQYDFSKYLTFGAINSELVFSEAATKDLMLELLKQPSTGKVFIEPHLKSRLRLKSEKIRFHGCQAVRHDDHIHLQLR